MYQVQFTATTSAGWAAAIAFTNDRTDMPMSELVDAAIELEVQSRYDRRELSASTADGTIQRPQAHIIQWRFTSEQMRNLRAGTTYEVGCLAITPGGKSQLFTGTLALIDGDVS